MKGSDLMKNDHQNKEENDNMKIMFIPDFRKSNSYQSNLSSSIEKLCTNVYFSEGYVELPVSIIKYRPHILHIHWTYPFMLANSKIGTILMSTGFLFQLVVLKLLGIKIIWTAHNIVDHERRNNKSLEIFFTRIMVRLCDRIIVHCSSAKAEVERIYKKDSSYIDIIPHGNYIGQYENKISSEEARKKLNLNRDDIVFLNFGQIRPYKGILELIDTFKKFPSKNIKLIIAGKPIDTELTSEILKRCKDDDNIRTFLEFIPDKDIQIYMNASDIVVLPYKDILTSGSMILAMSFAKPIIAPEIGCITDFLDNKGGFLYKTDLLNEMKNSLRVERVELENMGKNNEKIIQNYGWDEIGKRTIDTYQNSCKTKLINKI